MAESFGTGDAYSSNLAACGIVAEEIVANALPLQLAWAREHGRRPWSAVPRLALHSSVVRRGLGVTKAGKAILLAQIEHARPDVVYLQDLGLLSPTDVARLRPSVRLFVGQCGSAPPGDDHLRALDLVLTSFPHFVPRLRERGIRAEYFRLGFDARVLERIAPQRRTIACSFVGGFSAAHAANLAFLEHLARSDVDFFGYGANTLPATSAIRTRHHGPRWALDMYRVLAQSCITLNRHGAIAEDFANNMRLYEATGMGALLLTDEKRNLGELFAVGKEVVTYRTAEEAAELVRHYAAHPAEREAIARAGQQRTLMEHGYGARMRELGEILDAELDRNAR
jgi:hypothetical protein